MMKKITLKSLDDGQKSVEIPVGKTVIGRGPFLGCGDKKVSRSHAVLEVNDQGEVYLTPTHVNPCFYQPTAENPGIILKKDKAQKLKNGDSFSLLPRAFRYKLCVEGEGAETNEACADICSPVKSDEKVNGIIVNEVSTKTAEPNAKDDVQTNEKSNGNDPACEPVKVAKESLPDSPSSSSSKESPKKDASQGDEEKQAKEDVEMNGGDSQEQTKVDSEAATPASDAALAAEETKESSSKEEEVIPDAEQARPKKDNDEKDSPGIQSLPGWMKESDASQPEDKKRPKSTKQLHKEKATAKRKTESNSPEKKRKKKTERRKNEYSDDRVEYPQRQSSGRSSRTNRQTRQTISLDDFVASDDDEWQSDKSEPRHKKRRRSKRKNDDDSGSDWEAEHKKSKKVSHKFSSGSESGSDWGASSQKKKKTPKTRRRRSKRVNENENVSEEEEEEDEDEEKSSVGKPEKRYPCQYGKKCFRKNQSHLDEFSHPGDSDYDSADAEEKEDPPSDNEESRDLPECPFGTNCFRKNIQHKKEYKHSKKFRPQRESAKQTAGKKATKDDDLNDKEEELLEDSDEYKPVDSGSEVESSQESAKGPKITKNKRMKRV